MTEIMKLLMGIFGVSVFIMVLVFALLVIYKMLFKDKPSTEGEAAPEQTPTEEKYPYVLNSPMLSKKELAFYRALKPIATELGLTVFSKVRLADLLNVPDDTANKMKWFNHVKAKHIDFVLVDADANIKVIIEVDDKTHSRADRQQRDEFIDKAFKQLGLEVLHIYSWGTNYGGVDLKATIVNALKPADQSEPVSL